MVFRIHNRFSHEGRDWAVGEYNNRADGGRDFANAIHSTDNSQSYGLRPEVQNDTVVGVTLTSAPEVPGLTLDTLAPELRNRFATALEWSAKQANVTVEPEMLEAIKEGRDLKAERDSANDFTRLTKDIDHDLEAAYMLRDSLRKESRVAFDEGRDEEAAQLREQLAEVNEDIKGYYNPHKERGVIERELTPQQEEEVELFGMVVSSDVELEAPRLAAAHFGVEEAEALQKGDKNAAAEAGEKAQNYVERVKASREKNGELER